MLKWQFSFLGPVRLQEDGRPIQLTAAKAVALLGYLAVRGQRQSRDHLADLLWPESLFEAARKNLRNTLWLIRKTLTEEIIEADNEQVGLAGSVWIDVPLFEQLGRALQKETAPAETDLQALDALYRGPLLEGVVLADAPDFEIWLATERQRLGQLYLRAAAAAVAAHRAAGRWQDVIQAARQALVVDHLQESMHQALMEAYAQLGERTAALRQYAQLRDLLAREWAVPPQPETDALDKAIRDGKWTSTAAALPTATAATQPVPEPMAARRHQPRLPFIGRRHELAALDKAYEQAAAGQVRVVLLTGELGIGKTRLWQAWSTGLGDRQAVLETRCPDTTHPLPYAPLTTLLRQPALAARLFGPPSSIPIIWLSELARLLPEISTGRLAPPVLPPEEERRRLFEALAQTLLALSGRPLVLFLDDLHWVDQATLDWLVYLVDRLHNQPLLLVGAYRPSDVGSPVARVTASWQRQGLLRRLPLARLAESDTQALLATLNIAQERSQQLHIQSAGNPYLLIELARAAPGDTPAALAELLRERLKRLPVVAFQVVQAATVLEEEFDFQTLQRTSGRQPGEVVDALDVLLAADVLAERDGRYAFVHPLVAAVVREDLGQARRSLLHSSAAEALAPLDGEPAAVAGRLAFHLEKAGRPAEAATYAEMAAERALSLAASTQAAFFYRQALRLEPTPARLMGLGQALQLQGQNVEARETLVRALAAFSAADDTGSAARACLALAETYLGSGSSDLLIEWAERAVQVGGDAMGPELYAHVHFLLGAGTLRTEPSLAVAESHLLEAARLATTNNLAYIGVQSRFELGNLFAERGDLTAAVATFQEVITLAQQHNNPYQEVLGYNNLAYHAALAGDLALAHEAIEHGLALADNYSFHLPRLYLYSSRGEIALIEERFAEAESWFQRALKEAGEAGDALQMANLEANLGRVAHRRGELDEALTLLEAARQAVTGLTAEHLEVQIDVWLAELYLERGEHAATSESLQRALARLEGSGRQMLLAAVKRISGGIHSSFSL